MSMIDLFRWACLGLFHSFSMAATCSWKAASSASRSILIFGILVYVRSGNISSKTRAGWQLFQVARKLRIRRKMHIIPVCVIIISAYSITSIYLSSYHSLPQIELRGDLLAAGADAEPEIIAEWIPMTPRR